MDKFGIFSLLNSLLNTNKPSSDNGGELNKTTSDTSAVISNLLGSLTKPKESTPKNINTPPFPLQQNMLGTMNSHDEFVKRVLQKNPQK